MSSYDLPEPPLDFGDEKIVNSDPAPLEYQLLDDPEIGNFLRDRPEDIINPFHLNNSDHNHNNDDLHFQPKHEELNHHQSYRRHPQHQSEFYHNQSNHNSLNHPHYSNHNQALSSELSEPKSKPIRKCICKKTQCLKMYCECFASNLPCTEQCACIECKNTDKHQKQIIEAKQMIQEKGIVGLHSCSLSQKRCNCKKSNCLKKYCECYNSGVKCSEACKCESCKNCDNQNESENDNEKVTKAPKAARAKKQKKNPKVEVKN